MKKLVIASLTVLLLVIIPRAHASAATYYIAANGSASNNGTSSSTPWPISKVASVSFLPGDNILFNRGDTFNNVSITFTHSGSAGSPITFDAYGAGANPVLDGGALTTPILYFQKANYIVLNDLVFQNNKSTSASVFLYTVHDITIHNNFFTNVESGVYIINGGSNIVFDGNYALNLQGPFPRGEMIQFNNVSGSGNSITNNKVQNISGQSGPEDDINLYQSNGTPSSPIMVSGNWVEGGGPDTSGVGINLGDGGNSSYETATNNIVVDSGHGGMSVSGGTNMTVSNNQIYASKNPWSAVGMQVNNFYTSACSNITVSNNQVNWTNSSGALNPTWNSGNCGTVTGWSTNDFNASITASILPNPLWSGTPWNTALSVVTPPVVTPPTPIPPAPPSGVTATAGDGQATISFTAPSSNNPITSYTVTAIPGNITATTSSASPVTLTGLTNGTIYTITVTATSSDGTSNPSIGVSVTPIAPVVIPPAPVTTPTTPASTDTTGSTPTTPANTGTSSGGGAVSSGGGSSGGGGGGGGGGAGVIVYLPTGCTNLTPFSAITGLPCNSSASSGQAASAPTIPAGCTTATMFSPTNGQKCPNYGGSSGITTAPVASSNPLAQIGSGQTANIPITQSLSVGIRSTQVTVLQQYLNDHGFTIATSGAGSPGNETTYFGPATKAAVQKFQIAHNITPASGFVGPLTRAAINGATTSATGTTTTTSVTTQAITANIQVVVTAVNLNVHSTLGGAVVGTVPYGAQGKEIATSGKWIEVTFTNGTKGWVSKAYVTEY